MGEVIQGAIQQAGPGDGLTSTLVMLGMMFLVIYFLMIRPQKKQQDEHRALLTALKKGDEVVLSSGIFGKVWAVEENTVQVEIADKTRIKVLKNSISQRASHSASQRGSLPAADKVPEGEAETAEESAGASGGGGKKKKKK